MQQTGKLTQVVKKMDRYNMDIIRISEARWTGSGMMKERSGREDNQHKEGEAIVMSDKAAKALMEWKPLEETLIIARLNSRYN